MVCRNVFEYSLISVVSELQTAILRSCNTTVKMLTVLLQSNPLHQRTRRMLYGQKVSEGGRKRVGNSWKVRANIFGLGFQTGSWCGVFSDHLSIRK